MNSSLYDLHVLEQSGCLKQFFYSLIVWSATSKDSQNIADKLKSNFF